jgi:predicted RND superfamily exporter protein
MFILEHPQKVILVGSILYIIFALCAVFLVEYETKSSKLWYKDTVYLDRLNEQEDIFNTTSFLSILIEKGDMDKMDLIHSTIMNAHPKIVNKLGNTILPSEHFSDCSNNNFNCVEDMVRLTYYMIDNADPFPDMSNILEQFKHVTYIVETSVDQAIEDVVLNNIYLVAISFVLIFNFSLLVLDMNIILAHIAPFCFLLSVIAGIGIASIFNLTVDPLTMIIPFLFMCVGNTGIFLYHDMYKLEQANVEDEGDVDAKSISQKIIPNVATSVTLSYVTTMLVMVFNMIIPLSPAIFTFSFVGFFGLLFMLFFQLMLLPAIYLHQKTFCKPRDPFAHVKFDVFYDFMTSKVYIKWVVFFVYIGYLGLCAYFVSQLETEFRVESVIDEKSQYAKYREKTLLRWEDTIPSTVYWNNIELSALQAIKIKDDIDMISEWDVVEEPIDEKNWANAYFYQVGDLDFNTFKTWVNENPFFKKDLILSEDKIVHARMNFNEMVQTSDDMETYFDTLPEIENGYISNQIMLIYDSVNKLLESTAISISSTVVILCIVAVIGLRDIRGTIKVTFMMLSSLVMIVGTLVMAGIKLDKQVQVNTLLVLGVQIDSFIHFMYRYITVKSARQSLMDVGVPILKGLISTSLGCICLFAATAEFFRTFALMFNIMVVSAGFHIFIFSIFVLN